MKKAILLLSLTIGCSTWVVGQGLPKVPGSPSYPTTDIIDHTQQSPYLSTLARALQSSGLAPMLREPGAFTLFAPSNDAFAKLPVGTLEGWFQSTNRPALARILNYHLVRGSLMAVDLARAVRESGGRVTLKTLNGAVLTVSLDGPTLLLTDEMGSVARLIQVDDFQKNGIVHLTDGVLTPK